MFSSSWLTKLHFFRRCDKDTPPDNASIIPKGLFFADAVVPEICVPDPEGFPVPVVTECFQIPIVEMLTTDFQMNDHPFLFSIYIRHRSAMLL